MAETHANLRFALPGTLQYNIQYQSSDEADLRIEACHCASLFCKERDLGNQILRLPRRVSDVLQVDEIGTISLKSMLLSLASSELQHSRRSGKDHRAPLDSPNGRVGESTTVRENDSERKYEN